MKPWNSDKLCGKDIYFFWNSGLLRDDSNFCLHWINILFFVRCILCFRIGIVEQMFNIYIGYSVLIGVNYKERKVFYKFLVRFLTVWITMGCLLSLCGRIGRVINWWCNSTWRISYFREFWLKGALLGTQD